MYRALWAFAAITVTLGVTMRWDLATGAVSALGLSFPNLRHAHSHAGFYGVLTLAWWLIDPPFGPRLVRVFVSSAFAATVLFAASGYWWPTIALSTVVAVFWLGAAWRESARREPGRWLSVAPWGVAAGCAIVPAIAILARRDFAFSRELAHFFVALVLFTVFAPAAWQRLGARRALPAPLYFLAATSAAAALIFGGSLGPVALISFAAVTSWIVWGLPAERALWLVLPVSLVGACVPELRGYQWRIAGLHLLILGPLLTSLLAARPPRWLGAVYWATLAAMTLSVITGPPRVTALASTVFGLAAAGCGVLVLRVAGRCGPEGRDSTS